MRTPQIFAHRGARRQAPENTLPAFQRAIELGVDGIELDVHCSRDGKLVVFHDFALDGLTNVQGPIAARSALECARIDAGSHFAPQYATVGIPTLDEVFDLVGDRCRINVEIKDQSASGGNAVAPLAAMIQARNLCEQVIVSSFNPMALIQMRWVQPRIELGLLFEEPLAPWLRHAWFTPILQPQALHPWSVLVDEELMQWAREMGCAVNVWTVNELEEAHRLAALGVDAIITDVPDEMVEAIG